nr:RNA polymerase sigma factor SigI [Bacillus massiliglaciei]
MHKKRSLESTILKIQSGDTELRNEIIHSFKPFIAKTVSSVCKRYITESDDEFSMGLIAFNDAIDKFTPEKGSSLLSFADILIRRKVIDYLRSQSRNQEMILDMGTDQDEGSSQSFLDNEKSLQQYEQIKESEKRIEEIQLYTKRLSDFSLTFNDLVKSSPKHADAREGAIKIAKTLMSDHEMKEFLFAKKRLPIKQLEDKVQVSRKTIERNRKYIIAISIILNGEFLYLFDYIKGVNNA